MKQPNITRLALGAAFALVLGAFHAQARSPELINQRLNETLQERVLVEKNYGANDAAVRPETLAVRNHERIEVELNPELGGSGKSKLRDHDRPDRLYREARVEAKLDREMKDIEENLPLTDNPFDTRSRRRSANFE